MTAARIAGRLTVAVMAFALWAAPGVAAAHGDEHAEPSPTPDMGMPRGAEDQMSRTTLRLEIPEEVDLGDTVTIRATLQDDRGRPVEGATITFLRSAFLGEELAGDMIIGTATTDHRGVASLEDEIRTTGEVHLSAMFEGDPEHLGAEVEEELKVLGDGQLYEPRTGIRVPWLNLWVLAGVIALVWAVYFRVGLRVLAIAGSRPAEVAGHATAGGITRREIFRRALPLGSQLGIAAFGVGLVALVARSPRTHGNLMAPPATARYSRTPVARLGIETEMRPMPEPLDREVSFQREVLPVLLAYGGPHVVQPKSSPPPGGLRLDGYQHIMGREGIVVPGEPEESELVEHLLSPGMQMPPSVMPLPTEKIQLIVTWIAQGAKDN